MKTFAGKIGIVLLFVLPQIAPRVALCANDPAATTVQQKTVPDLLTAEARRMIADYPDTRYSHKTYLDTQQGICEVDCSGFIVVLLKHKAPKHLELIRTTHKRALAEDFYAAFTGKQGAAARGWKPIERLAEAKPGDVLTWIKLDRVAGDNTGHVMLIAEDPVPESAERYRVRILDSTLHGHAHDDRTKSERSGIGEGTLWLDVNDRGRPIGYRWKSRTGMLHTAPIAIGRAIPFE